VSLSEEIAKYFRDLAAVEGSLLHLVDLGLVEQVGPDAGMDTQYSLTDAGRDLFDEILADPE